MSLQFHMSAEPFFQVAPRADFVVDRRSAILNLIKISLQHFVNEAFLAFEVVIELAFSGSRSLDDVIGAGRPGSLLVKQVRCRANNSQAGFRASGETCLHTCSSYLYTKVQPALHAIAGSVSPFFTSCTCFLDQNPLKNGVFGSPPDKRSRLFPGDNFLTKT